MPALPVGAESAEDERVDPPNRGAPPLAIERAQLGLVGAAARGSGCRHLGSLFGGVDLDLVLSSSDCVPTGPCRWCY